MYIHILFFLLSRDITSIYCRNMWHISHLCSPYKCVYTYTQTKKKQPNLTLWRKIINLYIRNEGGRRVPISMCSVTRMKKKIFVKSTLILWCISIFPINTSKSSFPLSTIRTHIRISITDRYCCRACILCMRAGHKIFW